jgi:NADH dehydrogenase FAD-containing subunit
VDPHSGHVPPPPAQLAEEGETAARNLDAELKGRPLEAFTFHDNGFVVSAGARRGVADIAGITSGGQLAHLLKDAIEWKYRQSASHLRAWNPITHAKRLGGTGSTRFAVGSGYAALQEPIRECEV